MNNLSIISGKYSELIPNRFLGLVVIQLYERIENEDIKPIFSISDIESCVEDTKKILNENESSQTEHWLQKLLTFFLEQPPGKYDQFTLTEYARRFSQLLIEKLENPYKGLPLADTFQRYFTLDHSNIQSLNELRQWYSFGFEETVRKAVNQHLEALQDNVNDQLDELQELLDIEELEAQKKIRKFTIVFSQLAQEARDLSESLELGMSSLRSISKVVEDFESRIYEEENAAKSRIQEFEEVRSIQNKVRVFFDKIDLRMELIQNQITFASSKLSELQHNFKERALFKIRLKKFYFNLLNNSKLDQLPNGFEKAEISLNKIKYYYAPYYDFEVITKHPGVIRSEENEYSLLEREKVEQSMYVQERTNHWIDTFSNDLDSGHSIDFGKKFFDILEEEENLEIPIQVGHGLIQRSQHNNNWDLKISKELEVNGKMENISLWKILLEQKQVTLNS